MEKLKQLFGVRKNMAYLLFLLLEQPQCLLSSWSKIVKLFTYIQIKVRSWVDSDTPRVNFYCKHGNGNKKNNEG